MTPKEALANLDKAASMLQLNRADHIALVDSVAVLSQLLVTATQEAHANASPPAEPIVSGK